MNLWKQFWEMTQMIWSIWFEFHYCLNSCYLAFFSVYISKSEMIMTHSLVNAQPTRGSLNLKIILNQFTDWSENVRPLHLEEIIYIFCIITRVPAAKLHCWITHVRYTLAVLLIAQIHAVSVSITPPAEGNTQTVHTTLELICVTAAGRTGCCREEQEELNRACIAMSKQIYFYLGENICEQSIV